MTQEFEIGKEYEIYLDATSDDLLDFGVTQEVVDYIENNNPFIAHILNIDVRGTDVQFFLRLITNEVSSFIDTWWFKSEWIYAQKPEEIKKIMEVERMEISEQKEVITKLMNNDSLVRVKTQANFTDDDERVTAFVEILTPELIKALKLCVVKAETLENRDLFGNPVDRYLIKRIINNQLNNNGRFWFSKELIDTGKMSIKLSYSYMDNFKRCVRELPNLVDKLIKLIRDTDREYTVRLSFENKK